MSKITKICDFKTLIWNFAPIHQPMEICDKFHTFLTSNKNSTAHDSSHSRVGPTTEIQILQIKSKKQK